MVERSLSMREVPGSIPGASTECFAVRRQHLALKKLNSFLLFLCFLFTSFIFPLSSLRDASLIFT